MKATLTSGLEFTFRFRVPVHKTVPALYPEAAEFQQMPQVFATGYMVGLIEWACIQAVNPHLDWPHEQTVGIRIDVDHTAATPPGLEVTVVTRLVEVDGKRLVFAIRAHDGVDTISTGTHERFVIDAAKFNRKVSQKAAGIEK